jgi:uncharacterized membrane protein
VGKQARKRSQGPEVLDHPRRDWGVAALSAVGLAIGVYLGWLKLAGGAALFCAEGSGCDVVQASRYATLLGVPTALWGAGLYAAIGALALSGLTPRRWLAAFLLAAGGVAFSIYLTALSLLVIGVTCSYCLASLAVMSGVLALLVWRRPPVPSRRSPLRPARLATLGSLAGIGVVVAGAFVFAWDTAAAPDYQAALALHLKDKGAIMYGAYW